MAPTIDRKLNLVLTIEQDTGRVRTVKDEATGKEEQVPVVDTLYAHSTPIAKQVFHRYAILLGEAVATVYGKGFGVAMAGRLFLILIREIAEREGPDVLKNLEQGFVSEIERLTSVVALDPDGNGWKTLPLAVAKQNGIITDDEHEEVLSNAAFFTAASWLQSKKQLQAYVFPMMKIYSAQIVSSTPTEFARSLKMPTPDANTGGSPEANQSSPLV
jgi:hypothetical protein